MRRLCSAGCLLVTFAVGCGGGSDDSSDARTQPDDSLHAARAAVKAFINENDCSLLSEGFLAENFTSADEGIAACEAQADDLAAGDYSIASAEPDGEAALVTVKLSGGGTKTYSLVQDGGWRIDEISNRFVGQVGATFPLREAYEENGRPVEVDIRVTVLDVDPDVPAPEFNPPEAGNRWARARVRIKSLGEDSFSQSTGDIEAVGANGERFPAIPFVFEPSLGDGVVPLVQGDTVVGLLGFQVPQSVEIAEIRLSSPTGATPLQWKVP